MTRNTTEAPPDAGTGLSRWVIGTLWLFATFVAAFALMAWLQRSGFDATQRRFFLAVCLVAGGAVVVVAGLLSRSLLASCAGAALGVLIGGFAHHALTAQAAARIADAQARESAGYHAVVQAAAGDAGTAAVADAWQRVDRIAASRLVCRAVLDDGVSLDTLMRMGEGLVAAGDAAAPIGVRRHALLLVLAEIEMRHDIDGRLPAWLSLWRSHEPPGTATVDADFPVTSDPDDECAAIGNGYTIAGILGEGGLPVLALWHEAGFALTPWQQQAVLSALVDAEDVDAALSARAPPLDVDAVGRGYLTMSDTTALMEQAFGAGLRLQSVPEDAEAIDVVEAFLRHGADPALTDHTGRDACALFEEALSPGAEDAARPEGSQITRARALLCQPRRDARDADAGAPTASSP